MKIVGYEPIVFKEDKSYLPRQQSKWLDRVIGVVILLFALGGLVWFILSIVYP